MIRPLKHNNNKNGGKREWVLDYLRKTQSDPWIMKMHAYNPPKYLDLSIMKAFMIFFFKKKNFRFKGLKASPFILMFLYQL